jgi:hypothetical protein
MMRSLEAQRNPADPAALAATVMPGCRIPVHALAGEVSDPGVLSGSHRMCW